MKINDLINRYIERTKIYRRYGTYDYYSKVAITLNKALKSCNLIYVSDLQETSQNDILKYYKNETIKKNSQINASISFFYTVLNHYRVEHKLDPFQRLRDDTTSYKPLNDITLINLLKWLKTLDLEESNNSTWVLAIYIMLETGVRLSEVLSIKTSNVDIYTSTILLDETKNGRNRIAFFDILSRDLIIQELKKNNEYLIWNYNKNVKMNRRALIYFFDKIQKHFNYDDKITAHRLRKTFAQRLLRSGCPLTTIQKLLGHTDIRMTMKYLEVDQDILDRDYFKYYPYQDIK